MSRGVDKPPSFEAAFETKQYVNVTHDAYRLYWTLDGPLSSAIRVMGDKWLDADTTFVPYCN